jgi:hypothetical protein
VIPDFPVLKEAFSRAMSRYMKMRMDHGPLAQVPRGRVFEGGQNVLVREDGSREETQMYEAGSEVRISADEIRSLHLPNLLQKLDAAAEEIVSKQAKNFYETISKGVEQVGNTLDAGGRRLTVELFLEAFQKISIDFNPDGSPQMPTVHISPGQKDDVTRMVQRLETEPALKQSFDDLIASKREEWRAREANRKLVG